MSTTTNLDTLKINYLTQAQYNTAVTNNQINANQLYFTPMDGLPLTTTSTLDATKLLGTIPVGCYTDNSVSQIEGTSNIDYRILLSASANNDTETTTVRKSGLLTFNPNTNTLNIGNTNPKLTISNTLIRFTNSSGVTYDVKPTSIVNWDRTNNINTGWTSPVSTPFPTASVAAGQYAIFSDYSFTLDPSSTYIIMASCSFPSRSTGGICTFGIATSTSTTAGNYKNGFIDTVPAQNDGTIYLNVCGLYRNTSSSASETLYLKAYSTIAATASLRVFKKLKLYEGSY